MRTVTILLLALTFLSSCTTNTDYINCRQNIVTYGDALDCVIILDEVLKKK